MNDPLILAVAALVILGTGQLAALIGILLRYAIPKAPVAFHVPLILSIVASSSSCFALAWVGLSGDASVAGISTLGLLAIFFISDAITFWTLVAYAVFYWVKGRRCPV